MVLLIRGGCVCPFSCDIPLSLTGSTPFESSASPAAVVDSGLVMAMSGGGPPAQAMEGRYMYMGRWEEIN